MHPGKTALNRRGFLRTAMVGGGVAALSGALGAPDANGIELPAGFSSRVIARSTNFVPGTLYLWHPAPDGGACFATGDGGWIYVSNSEVPLIGGASAVRFNAQGGIASAYRILSGLSGTSGPVGWQPIPDPDGSPATRGQVAAAAHFDGGEGCFYTNGICYFTTKGDNRVWAYDAVNQTIDLAYDDSLVSGGAAPLTGVDNITGARSGDLFIAEDGGNMEINVITPSGVVAPFLRVNGQGSSEITGPAFSPDGRRLYFSSQRGTSNNVFAGITYEVTG